MKARGIAEKGQSFQLYQCHAELGDKQVWKDFMAKKNGTNSPVEKTTVPNHDTRPTTATTITTTTKTIPLK